MRKTKLLLASMTLALLLACGVALAAQVEMGYRDFQYNKNAPTPTSTKPQSKLWYTADGTWWGVLFNKSTNRYDIYRFDKATQSWSDTGTVVDARGRTRSDTLWNGTNLYVATSAIDTTTTDQNAYLRRYSYDPATNTYTMDTGFPAVIGNGPMEALNFDQDSTGLLWATYTQPNAQGVTQLYVTHSQAGNDASWATPFVPPVTGPTVKADDISAVVAFDLNTEAPKIGLVWSNQPASVMYFSSHTDGAPDTSWSPSIPVIQGKKSADDHINLKSLQTDPSGRIFVAAKTSFGDLSNASPDATQIYLAVLGQNGAFSRYTVSRVQDDQTRPIVLIDTTHRQLYVFAAGPNTTKFLNEPKAIYYKQTSLDNISFPDGEGTPFIKSSLDTAIDNPTSTKQNVNASSGLLVEAQNSATHYYLHNFLDLNY